MKSKYRTRFRDFSLEGDMHATQYFKGFQCRSVELPPTLNAYKHVNAYIKYFKEPSYPFCRQKARKPKLTKPAYYYIMGTSTNFTPYTVLRLRHDKSAVDAVSRFDSPSPHRDSDFLTSGFASFRSSPPTTPS
jgi:hypothetical protein